MEKYHEFWQFSLDAAWDQHRRHPELSRGKCLAERSYFRSLLNGDNSEIFIEACRLADSVEDKAEMEKLFPRVLERAIAAAAERAESYANEFASGRCFRYATLENNWCYIHIYNSKQPESFLADSAFVVDNFHYIMDEAEKNDGCDTMYTASWLNSLPAFLKFFPDEYHRNLVPAGEFGPTLGFQGQFVNRMGWLNKKMAARFLDTGTYPCARVESHCSFESLRKHLDKFY
ncbi:MAG: hypothetical protein E7051_00045 [Lentisphaerae bacterium]|nr:hypothetical protein [Lentisphaerota bacterium]MBQ4328138.1 hypothetical protein [Lentisphaeria bacterium]